MNYPVLKWLKGLPRRNKFEMCTALFLISIPLILKWVEGASVYRPSISNYVCMFYSHVYGILVTIAAMLFLYNGILFFSKSDVDDSYSYKKNGRWYNVILGLSLFGVVLIPHHFEFWGTVHFIFAGIFFIGSAIAIVVFTNKRHKFFSWILAILIGVALFLHFGPTEYVTLLEAEWLGLGVIGIHYFLEAWGIISLQIKEFNNKTVNDLTE